MSVLAIVGRELRRTARVRGTYLVRALYLALLVAIVYGVWWDAVGEHDDTSVARLSRAGRALYAAFFLVTGSLALLVCPILTCGAIADETESRTLEVLLTTPLRRAGIVLAKFASRMAFAGMLFLASLPAMIGCLAFGGVAPWEVLASAAMLVAGAFWAGALAIMYSALVRRGYAAALLAYFTMAVWTLSVVLVWAISVGFRGAPNLWVFVIAAPTYYCGHVVGEWNRMGGTPAEHIAGVLAFFLATGTAALAVAGRCLGLRLFAAPRAAAPVSTAPRRWHSTGGWARWGLAWAVVSALVTGLAFWILPPRHHEGFAAGPITFLVCVLTVGASLCRVTHDLFFRRRAYRAVWSDPFLWKELALPGTLAGRLTAAVVTGAMAAIGILALEGQYAARDDDPPIAMLLGIQSLMIAITAVVGGYSITAEREQGLLELILATPARPARILLGKLAGTLGHLVPLAAFGSGYLFAGWIHGAVRHPGGMLLAIAVVVTAVVFQAVVSCACSLWAKKSTTAILLAFAVPIGLYGIWPLAWFWLYWTITGSSSERDVAFFALQPNPFYFVAELAEGRDNSNWTWQDYPVPWEVAYGLHLALFVALSIAIATWTVRNLRARSLAG